MPAAITKQSRVCVNNRHTRHIFRNINVGQLFMINLYVLSNILVHIVSLSASLAGEQSCMVGICEMPD